MARVGRLGRPVWQCGKAPGQAVSVVSIILILPLHPVPQLASGLREGGTLALTRNQELRARSDPGVI